LNLKKKSVLRHFALATLLISTQKQTPLSFISTTQTDELKEIFVRQNKPEEHTPCAREIFHATSIPHFLLGKSELSIWV
jgi:hypothetical protein